MAKKVKQSKDNKDSQPEVTFGGKTMMKIIIVQNKHGRIWRYEKIPTFGSEFNW